jgi:very-short-patch-repair endonuclease
MNTPKRIRIARRLRRDATEAEQQLWRALRELPGDYRFRRQHPIGRRIADFACPVRKLVIELDEVNI